MLETKSTFDIVSYLTKSLSFKDLAVSSKFFPISLKLKPFLLIDNKTTENIYLATHTLDEDNVGG
jgi:hypothetical protein